MDFLKRGVCANVMVERRRDKKFKKEKKTLNRGETILWSIRLVSFKFNPVRAYPSRSTLVLNSPWRESGLIKH